MLARLGEHIAQRGPPLLQCRRAFALLRRAVVFGDCHADLLRQIAHGIDEAHARVLDQKADGVAMHTAAEAVVGLTCRADDETRRLLAMEGAQALVVDACFLQLHMAPDHFDDVDARQQVLDEGGRDHADSLAVALARHADAGCRTFATKTRVLRCAEAKNISIHCAARWPQAARKPQEKSEGFLMSISPSRYPWRIAFGLCSAVVCGLAQAQTTPPASSQGTNPMCRRVAQRARQAGRRKSLPVDSHSLRQAAKV